jgi:sugar phosphate isomerase/epimerase
MIGGAVLGSSMRPVRAAESTPDPKAGKARFRYCFNTATIRGQKLGIVKEVEIAASAGYDGIEPWVEAVNAYAKNGGSLPDLKKRIADAGLRVEGAISFPEWIVDDDERRAKGLERAKREMELMASIGGTRFAAPPAGATNLPKLDYYKAAERYRALLEAGAQVGIVPMLELWGFSQNLNRLGECVWVAMETGHPNACVLADVFHMYKGGSNFESLEMLAAQTLRVFHMNDFPADPPRDKVNDGFRLYPGDGMAPFKEIIPRLQSAGGEKVLSLELFSQKYWAQDPLEVAKTGLAKMKAVVAKAETQ